MTDEENSRKNEGGTLCILTVPPLPLLKLIFVKNYLANNA